MRTLGARELNRALLARQLLLDRVERSPEDVVRHLVGLQAQAPEAAYVALWSRLERFLPEALASLLLARRAVRIPLMRATIHLVTANDALPLRGAIQPVLERRFASTPFARALDGVDLAELARQARMLLQTPRTRAALAAMLSSHWPERDSVALAYAATYLLPLVQVPPRGLWRSRGPAMWVDAETWIEPRPKRPISPRTLFARYLAAFGPATIQDFALWSGLANARRLVEPLPEVRRFRDGHGRELLDLDDAPRPEADTPAPPRFLPEYDNALLSHQDRGRIIDDGGKPPLPAGNGARAGTVLIDGFMRATWRLERRREQATLAIRPLARISPPDLDALAGEGEKLLAFLADPAANTQLRITAPV